MRIFLLFILLFTIKANAEIDSVLVEQKVERDLTKLLRTMIPEDHFIVQVKATTQKRMVRQLVEGESISIQNNQKDITIPPLPGFTPKLKSANNDQPQQSRQVYKMVEKTNLNRVNVSVAVSNTLDKQTVEEIEKLATSYIATNYPKIGNLSFSAIKMRAIKKPASLTDSWISILLWTLLAAAVLLTLIGAYWWLTNRKQNFRSVYPSVVNDQDETDYSDGSSNQQAIGNGLYRNNLPTAFNDRKLLPDPSTEQTGSDSDDTGAFPPLPATSGFVDQRTELLDIFLREAEIFRSYYLKLSEGARSELYAGLRGPAFDSLLDALELPIPKGADAASPPSEEQLLFYIKNFGEFIHSHKWQQNQFFGFLHSLSIEQLSSLTKSQNAFVAALMLKYMKANQSAAVLSSLNSEKRIEVLTQVSRTDEVSMEEMQTIEQSVRNQVKSLPNFIFGTKYTNVEFWTKILAETDDQDKILLDLEKTNPEIYPHLAKFRFKLEDLPSLPQPLIQKILDQVENDELAMALLTCPDDVVDFVKGKLSIERRELVDDQIVTYSGLPESKTKVARMSLTRKFREVIA